MKSWWTIKNAINMLSSISLLRIKIHRRKRELFEYKLSRCIYELKLINNNSMLLRYLI